MVVHRNIFFLLLFGIVFIIFPGRQLLWLMRSEKITGVFYFQGEGNALEQTRQTFVELYFLSGKDTVWLKIPGRLKSKKGDQVPVRYLTANPADARVDRFVPMWGSTVVYGGIFFALLLAIFLHPEIVPRHARLKLTRKRPFIVLVY